MGLESNQSHIGCCLGGFRYKNHMIVLEIFFGLSRNMESLDTYGFHEMEVV